MKKLVLLTAILGLFAFKPASEKGDSHEVIAVLNAADWCSICKSNGERAVGTFMSNNSDGYFLLVKNDITSNETKAKSLPGLKEVGVAKNHEKALAAGMFSFYDAKSKKLLGQVTVAHDNDEIIDELKKIRQLTN